ncbi:MAG: succinate dehydrogenase assembly factor 2 [Gammaproteobacteria bacterium]|uniref:FAD assembly factor SdhE n=1 Tax=Pseudomaricurvus alcaniphilus TaxID=1166482 RepID=UPI0014092F00|nr:succinate dehydrogenase assembly factor 2 [Pseudomaricurvus alcaniphilus]MBR9911682.1 succinate dehydrogenase assembly factor 2 [Gammaproteobacteria bacterium]NHN39373.1 succinate dehydrogenase assembly factor 2 [Pseudomaricurvus alcaniphilus]
MDKNRLFWASRRGMLELDLVLLPFLENVYDTLEQEDKERYWALMEGEDQDLFSWFMRRTDPEDPELKKIVDIIRANTGLQME